MVIWFDPNTQTGAVYRRGVNGRSHTFSSDPQNPAYFVDESGQQWAGISGTAVNGTEQLSPVISTPAFEFGWFGYFPESETYVPTP